MNINLKSLHIENFKGIKQLDIDFSNRTTIAGQNASGKTTIVDAVMWLLFGKNSQYVEKFDIRPLDADGNQIHFLDIVVSAVINIDGEDKEFYKKQSENWVKHRGSENPVLQGNVNACMVDGYPRSDKEYKEIVSEVIPEDLFKILTSPTYFPNMKWKEQRDVLMKFASTETDAEIAERIGGFELILDELKKAPSTADIQKKYALAMKELKAKQIELPTRIDEVSKQKVDYDVASIELQKTELEKKLAELSTNNLDDCYGWQKRLMDIDFEVSRLKQTAEADIQTKRSALSGEKMEWENAIKRSKNNITTFEFEINNLESRKQIFERELTEQGKKYFEVKESVSPMANVEFDENQTVCTMCGQKLPADKISALKADFNAKKAKEIKDFEASKTTKLNDLIKSGNNLKAELQIITPQIEEIKAKIETEKLSISKSEAAFDEVQKKISNLPVVNVAETDDYKKLVAEKMELESKIDDSKRADSERAIERSTVSCDLELANKQLAEARNNVKIDERIETLKAEQREVAQKIADCEAILYTLDNFIKAKLESISTAINAHFKIVKWKLFEIALNGGVTETCELTVNGVPYSDLNNGHKIIAGLDISNTLSEVYEKHAFVFVDNAESINEFNLPAMDNQLIRLCVSEDKELLVKGE